MKRLIILFIVTIFLFAGCKKEFLDLVPQGTIDENSLFSTDNGPQDALWGVYDILSDETYMGWAVWSLGSVASDDSEAGGNNFGADNPQTQELGNLTYSSTNIQLNEYWRKMFMAIQRANTIIFYLPQAEYSIEKEEAERIIYEARALRVWYYFELTKVFGPLPIYADPVSADEFRSTPRSSLAEVYDFLESECLAIANHLPQERKKGTMTQDIVNAILAKSYLYESSYAKNYPGDPRFEGMEQRWEDALEYAEKVIESPVGYRLVGIDGDSYETYLDPMTNGLIYMFTLEANNNSDETVFENQMIVDPEMYLSRGNLDYAIGNRFCACQQSRNVVDPESGANSEIGNQRFGFHCPSFDFMEEIETYFPDDPRLDYWVAREGDSLFWGTGTGGQWVLYANQLSPTLLHHRKADYINPNPPPEGRSGGWEDNPLNVDLIRIADVILWAAEAEFELGNTAGALNYINQIRRRARMCGTTKHLGQPEDLSTITFEDIVRERRMELCFEFSRFYDIVRWGIAEAEFSGYVATFTGPVSYVKGQHEFFPIPQLDIDKSEGGLIQNPGY